MHRVKQWVRRWWQGRGAEAPKVPDDFARLQASWVALGEHDPLWAIVGVPDKRGGRWDVQEFFANGAVEVEHVMAALARAGLTVRRERALDFGSGVGRLSQALATHFREVDGVDISTPMLEQARKYNRHGERVRYHLGGAERLPFAAATFDFVFSKIVLQHMGIALQRGYVREFLRVVKPGGLVMFQAVARSIVEPGTRFESPVDTPDGTVTIDMNVFPRAEVEDTIRGAGGAPGAGGRRRERGRPVRECVLHLRALTRRRGAALAVRHPGDSRERPCP